MNVKWELLYRPQWFIWTKRAVNENIIIRGVQVPKPGLKPAHETVSIPIAPMRVQSADPARDYLGKQNDRNHYYHSYYFDSGRGERVRGGGLE